MAGVSPVCGRRSTEGWSVRAPLFSRAAASGHGRPARCPNYHPITRRTHLSPAIRRVHSCGTFSGGRRRGSAAGHARSAKVAACDCDLISGGARAGRDGPGGARQPLISEPRRPGDPARWPPMSAIETRRTQRLPPAPDPAPPPSPRAPRTRPEPTAGARPRTAAQSNAANN